MLLSPKDNLSRVVANYPVIAPEGLVDVEQEDKELGLLQMGLMAGALMQLRGQKNT